MKKIILTGGGTAGHVTGNIALLPALAADGYEAHYVGGKAGIEQELIEPCGIPYYGISSGKLRRYFDIKNITDAFRVLKGFSDAFALMRRVKPDIVFSKGGFVTVPVVLAARLSGIPAVIHESDITPGLANRIAIPFADTVCVNFPETLSKVKKGALTGTPIRRELLNGDRFTGLRLCGFNTREAKPVVLFTGGSLGSAAINACLRESLPELLKQYHIIHLCGKGNLIQSSMPGYAQFEYATDEQPHLYALADIVVSRAGANTIFELLTLRKPNILIPLTREASRGDQILNAASFEKQGFSKVLPEQEMTKETLPVVIDMLYSERSKYIRCMEKWTSGTDGIGNVMREINKACKHTE